jgi:tetratricopeptide (TPR) repeat protein
MTGNYARALALYAEGLEIATAIGDRWFKAVCLTLHTALIGLTHSMVTAEITHERLQSVAAEWRLIGDPRLIAFALDFISRSALRLGRYDEARAALEENVALNRSVGFRWGLGTAYRGLGIVAEAQGKHQQAVEMFRQSLDTFTELGGSWWVAHVHADMGRSILALGKDGEAGRVWHEALRIATEIHAIPVALEALAGLASLQAKQGDREQALELLLMVSNHPASLQGTKNRAARLRAELEAPLTRQQMEEAQARALAKTFEAVVDEVFKAV